MNLTSTVQYGTKTGWRKGTLELSDDLITLKDRDGNSIFEYPVSVITKVLSRRLKYQPTAGLWIYTPDKKHGWSVGSIDKDAQSSVQEWVDFFQSRGIPVVQGLNLYKLDLIMRLTALIAIFLVLLVSVIISLSHH